MTTTFCFWPATLTWSLLSLRRVLPLKSESNRSIRWAQLSFNMTYSLVEHFNEISSWWTPHCITDIKQDIYSIGSCFEVLQFGVILCALLVTDFTYLDECRTFLSHTQMSPLPRPAHTWSSTTMSSCTESTHWGLSWRLKSATFNMAPLSLSTHEC